MILGAKSGYQGREGALLLEQCTYISGRIITVTRNKRLVVWREKAVVANIVINEQNVSLGAFDNDSCYTPPFEKTHDIIL